jgi:hypothetical protein
MDSTTKTVLLVALGVVLLGLLVTAVFLAVRLVRTARVLKAPGMPASGKFAFWAAMIYTVFPVDLLPDPIYLDDIGVLLGSIGYIGHLGRKHGVLGRLKAGDPRIIDVTPTVEPKPPTAGRLTRRP